MKTRARPPDVSIVLPVLNGESYLKYCLQAICAQTLQAFEVVIVDGGSVDQSLEIVYGFGDPRFRVLSPPCGLLEAHRPKGLAVDLNRGLRACRSNLIARVDADDICAPDRLERQVRAIEAHPDACVLGGGYEVIDSGGRAVRRIQGDLDPLETRWRLLFGNCLCHSSVIIRRDRWLDRSWYRSVPAEDYELWQRMSESELVRRDQGLVVKWRSSSLQKSAVESQTGSLAASVFGIVCGALSRCSGLDVSPNVAIALSDIGSNSANVAFRDVGHVVALCRLKLTCSGTEGFDRSRVLEDLAARELSRVVRRGSRVTIWNLAELWNGAGLGLTVSGKAKLWGVLSAQYARSRARRGVQRVSCVLRPGSR